VTCWFVGPDFDQFLKSSKLGSEESGMKQGSEPVLCKFSQDVGEDEKQMVHHKAAMPPVTGSLIQPHGKL